MVAMTEEEKKRLEEILSDIGDLMEEVCCVALHSFGKFSIHRYTKNVYEQYLPRSLCDIFNSCNLFSACGQRFLDLIWKWFRAKPGRGQTVGGH